MHHDRRLQLVGVVARGVEAVGRGADREPLARGDEEVGPVYRQVADHVLEAVAPVTVDDDEAPHTLAVQRRDDVGQDGLLRLVAGVDTEREFALPGVLRPQRHPRQHHGADTEALPGKHGGVDRDGVGEDAVGQIGQVEVVGLC